MLSNNGIYKGVAVSEPGMQRRLAAIMAVDVVGYSKMMGADETRTHTLLSKFWREEFRPVIIYHRGRVVKMLGDGALVEFATAVDAVTAAIALQETRARHNSEKGSNPAITFRIGINLGDIMMEEGDVFGRDVNIAARMERSAPEGGILISDSVYTQIVDKIGSGFRDAGRQTFKNIDRPVQCWSWRVGAGSAKGECEPVSAKITQKINFCRSHDGVEIVYATAGSGPPLVRAPHWMS
ncbi:MAG: adenylate/guanylate cyclase domain-containing protein, partial [Alphaproteobacteria bacterium]